MKKELNEISYKYKAVVPLGQRAVLSATEVSKRCVTQQESILGRLEEHELKYQTPAYLIAATESSLSTLCSL